ncbi:hypothetical protein LTR04_006205 [Oleoguttula sp. CCFEE 6159]|nr:hypothetical protein LTR04_006205 [Oleoguttula sp. CCFEE 6159]
MHISAAMWLQLAVASSLTVANSLRPRDYERHDYYAVHLNPSTSPTDVAAHLGLEYEGQLGELQDHYLFRSSRQPHIDIVEDAIQELRRRRRKREAGLSAYSPLDGVRFRQKQKLKPRMWKRDASRVDLGGSKQPLEISADKNPPVDAAIQEGLDIAETLGIGDPIFQDQWHLYNHIQKGHDINVTDVWMQGITGKNTTVCIIDDGLDMDSEDLAPNYFAEGSYDFNDKVDDPKPRLSDDKHGTRCAGEVSAARNDVCGVGVAWDSKIAGLRILSAAISDADEAIAMNYAYQKTQIYSCSWGPPDDGQSMDAPGILIQRAMVNAVQKGRDGLGTVYVFAAGNGAASDDNCNFDGYTNSIYSISVGAIDRKGLHPYYSEQCSAQLVVTYSSGSGDSIHTTDVGVNKCYTGHGGTSAAGPLAVGIYALVLQVRPDLTWRDIQWLTVMTAAPVDQPSDWQDTKIGKRFSHQFAYGKLDAWAIVEAAKNWTVVKPQAWYFSPWMHVKHDIPEGENGLASSFEVTSAMLKTANFERVEHVTVTMNVEHTRRGDLSVELRSPSGVVSHIATARRNDAANAGYVDWTFMSVAHFGEDGLGSWTVIVKDTNFNGHNGTFVDWRLRLWGECIDPKIQGLSPLPNDTDDDDHDVTSAVVSTTSVSVTRPTGDVPGDPTDHISRPVNQKPTSTASSTTTTSSSSSSSSSPPTATPSATTTSTPPPTTTAPSDAETTIPPSSEKSHFLPSIFPTFGVSARTQIWIYGAASLILIFAISLSIYAFLARRKRRQLNPRDDYEFEMLGDDDLDGEGGGGGDAGRAGGGAGGMRAKRRAGELYDAFAEGSDDEVFSDGEEDFIGPVDEEVSGHDARLGK